MGKFKILAKALYIAELILRFYLGCVHFDQQNHIQIVL